MKSLVNPVVRGLLRSPLHDLLGSDLVVVHLRGRRTGRTLSVPANAVAEGDVLTLTSLRRRAWWRNLRGGAPVSVTVAGWEREGWGEVVDASPEQLADAVTRAYERTGHPISRERAQLLAPDRVLVRIELGRPPAATPTALRGRRLWGEWTRTVSIGEAAAFSIPALAGALIAVGEPPALLAGLVILAAGFCEGVVLGLAQAYVIRQALPGVSSRRWITATALGALIAWAASLVPTSIGEGLDQLGTGSLIAGGVLLGGVFLLAMGGLQWHLLREHVGRAAWWIAAVAGAWIAALAAFMSIATPLWREGQPIWQIAAVGLLAGAVMALVMAGITGYALMRLVAVPRLTQARCRASSSP